MQVVKHSGDNASDVYEETPRAPAKAVMSQQALVSGYGAEVPLLFPSSAARLPAGGGGAPRRNRFAFVCATLASMTTMLHSYNLTLMSGAQLYILGAGWLADRLGRRCVLVIANAFLMAGALTMSLGSSFVTLMAARFITGIGSGFGRVVTPVYNTEISQTSTRGVLSSFLNIFINVGVLLSYVSNYAFSGLPVHLGWRIMYGVGVIPPVLIAAGILFMPESPRWLAMRGHHAEAHAVLLRTSDTPAEADLRLSEIRQAIAQWHQQETRSVWQLIVRRPTSLRRILMCVLMLDFFVPASGVEAIRLYSPLIFKAAGMKSNTAVLGITMAIGAIKICFILVGVLCTDRLGRRPLLLASTAGVTVTMTCLAMTLCIGAASAAKMVICIASVLAVVASYSIGYAMVVNTYNSEILPLRLRATGLSMGVAVNRLTSGLVTMTFISLADAITMPGCFFLYAGMTAAAFVFVYARLPETKGRNLEDMDVLFDK
ncbi:unnamed protein product [Urochloa decumbens]|uniref:Major facilitator superfamily (MFS) profile domain-containing protein n=1 Tax=Urochloa decumbens TaxID=240449 RepID=A0ABC9AS46_9POAL